MPRLRMTTPAGGAGVVLAALLGAGAPACRPAGETADLLIHGGSLVDGTGAPARHADVAVRDGRVVAVGDLEAVVARRTLDASGQVVAPGFVDLHAHSDLVLLAEGETQGRLLGARIAQGITTQIVGNCGLGTAPATEDAAAVLASVNGWMTPEGVTAPAGSLGAYLDRLERGGVALNVGTLVPHGPLRISAMGLAAGAVPAEALEAMLGTLEQALDAGALGLSAGLIYPPGMYADTDELAALAARVAARDGLVALHVRGSSETLLPATEELIEIARRSGARVHHSHMEGVGRRFWPDVARVLALEDAARDEGLRVSHDVFVYTRAATMMSAIFPPWSLEGGALLERLAEPASRERIRAEIESRRPEWPPWKPGGWPHNLVGAVGWEGIRVASVGPEGPVALVGRSLAEIAEAQGRRPFDVVADLMIAQQGQVGQQVDEISGVEGDDEVLLSILRHPAAAVISDADDYGRGAPHPAHAGAFARVLRLSREGRAPPLEETVRRMTSYPAQLAGLTGRGFVREGTPADLVIFDPETVTDRATWREPRRPAEGIRWVVINGRIVVDEGRYVGGLVGQVLRAVPASPSPPAEGGHGQAARRGNRAALLDRSRPGRARAAPRPTRIEKCRRPSRCRRS